MNIIKTLVIGQIMLSIAGILTARMLWIQDERINNLERVKLKTTQELIDEANELITTGKH